MNLPTLLSLLFFTAFAVYFFVGIYIFSISKNCMKNRVFFLLCLSLGVWSFAFSIANSAPDHETAFFWRRVSALGWGSLYSILLHFILILTEKTKMLRKKWFYGLIYIPALMNIYIFSLSSLAKGQYNLIETSAGWVNLSVNNVLDHFFNIYYICFTMASIGMVIYWRITVDAKRKKGARLLTASITLAFIMGSVTDILMSRIPSAGVPQMAPIIIIIPITAIFYSIRHYDLLTTKIEGQGSIEGKILNETSRIKLYQYISVAYILGSFIKIIASYFIYRESLGSVLLFSAVLLLCGISILIIGQIKINEDHKDSFVAIIISLSIPFITFDFIEYASITIWVAPVIFLMLSVLFDNRRILVLLSVTVLLTQIGVWIKAPMVMVHVEASDHITRIFIFAIFIAVTSYVNRIFINRLEENERQVRFQKIISEISADFVSVTKSNVDEKIRKLLKLVGEQYQLDRVCLFLFSEDFKIATYAYEWCNQGIEPAIDSVEEVSTHICSWWMNQIINCEEVNIPNLEMFPLEAEAEKEILAKLKIQSLLSLPVTIDDKALGYLGVHMVENVKIWRKDHRDMLKILSHILADVIMKVKAEEEIKFMAYYDMLTKLPNRMLFSDRLTKDIHLAKRTEKFIGVFFIDLDSFKAINDTMGHESGDVILKQVAYRLSCSVRKHDTVSRFGGDEFLIMLTNISEAEDIIKLAENIMKALEKPMIVKDQEFFITASAGIAVYPMDGEESEVLIKNADMAMYASKEQGKNKYTLCSPVLKEDILEKMKLTNSLYRAQERNELELYYQPQVNLETKKIIGLEALIRWNHPEMGMIYPKTFIPLAEKTGLIIPIGDWVLRTACSQNKAWQALGIPPVRMAVNLSAEQFRNPKLVSTVQAAIRETGLDPEYLELEITESIAVKGSVNIIQILNELKNLGVTIAIDDFGTEYSSLSRLKTLPIDRIKMDMEFIRSISKSNKDDAIVKVIIQLAQSLELKVIAEGVETKSQLDFLINQVCDEVQGYYYYKPMPAEEMERCLSLNLLTY